MLPGVTVEATSPVLIEKSRTAVTDVSGQYRIHRSRAGHLFAVVHAERFSVTKRDNIEIRGSGVIPINADLRLGALQETITVTVLTSETLQTQSEN